MLPRPVASDTALLDPPMYSPRPNQNYLVPTLGFRGGERVQPSELAEVGGERNMIGGENRAPGRPFAENPNPQSTAGVPLQRIIRDGQLKKHEYYIVRN